MCWTFDLSSPLWSNFNRLLHPMTMIKRAREYVNIGFHNNKNTNAIMSEVYINHIDQMHALDYVQKKICSWNHVCRWDIKFISESNISSIILMDKTMSAYFWLLSTQRWRSMFDILKRSSKIMIINTKTLFVSQSHLSNTVIQYYPPPPPNVS